MAKPKIAFINTCLAGVTMYRFANPMKYINKQKLGEVTMQKFDIDSQSPAAWEQFLKDKEWGPKILNDIHETCKDQDVIVFGKLLNPYSLGILAYYKENYPEKRVVFEIDDYMFNVPSWNMAASSFKPGSDLHSLGLAQIEHSDSMIVSTNPLKKLYEGNEKNIFVYENSIDPEFWDGVKQGKKGKKVRIGWAGANAHAGDIAVIEKVIDRINEKYDVEWLFWGPANNFSDELKKKKNVECDGEWVSLSKYPAKLAKKAFDIGIVPLADCYFNRGKSNIRFLELGMLGVPCITSDIGGQFSEGIKNGENGYLCRNEEQWVESLSRLIESEEERVRMGKNAQTTVNERYRADKTAKNYIEIIKAIRELPAKKLPTISQLA